MSNNEFLSGWYSVLFLFSYCVSDSNLMGFLRPFVSNVPDKLVTGLRKTNHSLFIVLKSIHVFSTSSTWNGLEPLLFFCFVHVPYPFLFRTSHMYTQGAPHIFTLWFDLVAFLLVHTTVSKHVQISSSIIFVFVFFLPSFRSYFDGMCVISMMWVRFFR